MLILILLLLNANLFALSYSSNAIGQLVKPISALSGNGYEVEVEGKTTSLYLDGELLEQRFEEDGIKRIVRGEEEEIIKTEADKRIYRSLKKGDELSEVYYEWDGDFLKRKRTVLNGELQSIITYIMDGETLLGYQEVAFDHTKLTLINNKKLGYTTEDSSSGEVINHFDNLIFKSEFSPKEEINVPLVEEVDDTLIITDKKGDGSVKTTYDKGGLILEKAQSVADEVVKLSNYTYDDERQIKEEVATEGDKKIFSSYKDGKLEKVTTYLKDELFSIRYHDAEIYEIRYRNGKPFARLTYDEDGKSLLELKIL